MIKILEAKPVPTATIDCKNCGSILEYGNADLHESVNREYNIYNYLTVYYFTCPVCGCKVLANWINREK